MKKVFVLALAFASITSVANAQKGTILVGGNVDFTSENQPNTPANGVTTKTNTVTFSPTVGYQFSNHFTAGLTSDISSLKVDNGTSVAKGNSFDLGPFIRYAQSLSPIFAVYGQLQGTMGSYKSTVSGNTVAKGNTVNVQLFPAAFINLKNSFGLNFSFGGISYSTDTPQNGSATKTFDINFGKSINIGISKNFGCMKTAAHHTSHSDMN